MENKQINLLEPQFARVINGKLEISIEPIKDYKPLIFAEIPKEFDQTKQYIVQGAAVDGKDSVDVGIEIREMVKEEEVVDNSIR